LQFYRLYHKLQYFLIRFKFVYHLLFWITYFILISFLLGTNQNSFLGKLPSIITVFLHAFVVYFNIYILIPLLLNKKKYLYYFFTLLLLILFLCFPLAFTFNNFYSDNTFLTENIWTPFFFITNIFYFLLIVFFTSFLDLFSKWYRNDKANKELEKVNIQNELKYLKSQINPHFLFNSFNSLYALTLSKSDKAVEMVESLSSILRYLLYETSEPNVSLEKEINYLQHLLKIEKIRIGDRANIEFEINGDISGIEIAPLLFINFVENSFKHGVNKAYDFAWVKIVLTIDNHNNSLRFEINNSKPDEEYERLNNNPGGIGLKNVKKRLKLLYPNKHILKINDLGETFSVDLLLNIK
jgi:two-component system LytT family sensor kinase